MHAKITLVNEYEEDTMKFIEIFKLLSFIFACSFFVIKIQNTEDGKKKRRIHQHRIRSLEELSSQDYKPYVAFFYFYVLIITIF